MKDRKSSGNCKSLRNLIREKEQGKPLDKEKKSEYNVERIKRYIGKTGRNAVCLIERR